MSILVTTTKTGTLRARAKPRCSGKKRGRVGQSEAWKEICYKDHTRN